MSDSPIGKLLTGEHRRLDESFGRFLGALGAGGVAAAAEAIQEFDRRLRRHTGIEERFLYPERPGGKLAALPGEEREERLCRELRLEHVQIRELSGMILHLLAEKQDLEGARRLAPNLARRWDAHTAREEEEVFTGLDTLEEKRKRPLLDLLTRSG